MEKFQAVSSLLGPLPMKDIDTDVIIPARYLTSTSRSGYGEFAFEPLRADPQFFLNWPESQEAAEAAVKILLVGPNFGCGSSREHAVWAIKGLGVKAIIGTDFADIFSGNAAKNGLLLVKLPEVTVRELFARAHAGRVSATVDLETQAVTLGSGEVFPFAYDAFRKTCLLQGLDDLDYLLSYKEKIKAHFAARPFYCEAE